MARKKSASYEVYISDASLEWNSTTAYSSIAVLKYHGKITCTLQSASSYTAERKYEVLAEKELYLFRLEQYHPLPFQFITD